MNRTLDRLVASLLLAFAAVGVALGYWGVLRGPEILARDDNPRLVDRERRLARGAIYDRDGVILAQSIREADGTYTRLYPHPETAPAVGYYSLRYGVDGVEAAFNATLRGSADYTAWDDLLHRPQVGGDVRLTLDLDVQTAVAGALGDRAGAVLLVEAGSGDVLALVSKPTFDPNTLDNHWEALTEDQRAPLLNRVTESRYQPGAALETAVLAAALERGVAPAVDPSHAAAPLELKLNDETITLACARAPAIPLADLFDAYRHACPAPFADLGERLGAAALGRTFEALGLFAPARLLPEEAPAASQPPPTAEFPALSAMSLGQGELTVNPAQMARVAAAVANGGALPVLRLVSDTRAPRETVWQPAGHEPAQPRVISAETAAQLQEAMRQGGGGNGVAGHASAALSGPRGGALAWFIGFAERETGEALAVVVVVEDETDASVAAQIGAQALNAARRP